MPIYVIAYDLNHLKDYDLIITELRERDCHAVQRSLWLGSFTNNAQDLLSHFKDFLDDDDNLFIAKVTKNQIARFKSLPGTNDWLARNND